MGKTIFGCKTFHAPPGVLTEGIQFTNFTCFGLALSLGYQPPVYIPVKSRDPREVLNSAKKMLSASVSENPLALEGSNLPSDNLGGYLVFAQHLETKKGSGLVLSTGAFCLEAGKLTFSSKTASEVLVVLYPRTSIVLTTTDFETFVIYFDGTQIGVREGSRLIGPNDWPSLAPVYL